MTDRDPIEPMEDEPKTTDELESEGTGTQDEDVNEDIAEDET